VELRHPGTLRALVNHAGFDVFGPNPPYTARIRKGWGGSPDATRADPEHMERRFGGQDWFERLKRDLDAAQGPGAWQAHVESVFRLWTTPLGYTFEDLRAVAIPTLVLVGDRDGACTVEDAVTTYRALPEAELCVLPHLHHAITAQSRDIALDFLLRHREG
jgi:pimeloyl-ACP methyl ester carboxylesterase